MNASGTHLSRVQDLLDLAQRVVIVSLRLENFQLLLHQDLDVPEL